MQVWVASRSGEVAYQTAFNTHCTVKSARQQASRKRKIPRIRARLIWLQQEEVRKQKGAGAAGAGGGADDRPGDAAAGDGKRMTRQEKISLCERIMRNNMIPWSDRVRAMDTHTKLESTQDGDELSIDDLDPTELSELFRKAEEQGKDVLALVKAAEAPAREGQES